jgi:uncharacterized membrane protein
VRQNPAAARQRAKTAGEAGELAVNDEPKSSSAIAWSPAEIGAIAHLYRGEMYQSKVWRTRLDASTNWAVVTTGIAMSVTFSSADASPIPMLLVSWAVIAFLAFEARRYRIYDIYRTRVRVMELNFYGPMLTGQGIRTDNRWNEYLADDYRRYVYHIGYLEAVGRRLRRNYVWLFVIHLVCYLGKIIIHPTPLDSLDTLWMRAAIGPLPGQAALAFGLLFHSFWMLLAFVTLHGQRAAGLPREGRDDDPLMSVA